MIALVFILVLVVVVCCLPVDEETRKEYNDWKNDKNKGNYILIEPK